MMDEHKSCVMSLENSGFSYDPIEFTKNQSNLYFYYFLNHEIINSFQYSVLLQLWFRRL